MGTLLGSLANQICLPFCSAYYTSALVFVAHTASPVQMIYQCNAYCVQASHFSPSSWFLLAFVWVGLGIFEIWAFWILIDTKPPNIMHFCGDLWGSSISSCRPRIVVARHCDACRFRAERRNIARRVIKKSIREMHLVASRGLASWIGVSFRSVCRSMHAPFSIPRNGGIGVACCRDLMICGILSLMSLSLASKAPANSSATRTATNLLLCFMSFSHLLSVLA